MPVGQAGMVTRDEVRQNPASITETFHGMNRSGRRVVDPTTPLDMSLLPLISAGRSDLVLKLRGVLPEVMPQTCYARPIAAAKPLCKFRRKCADTFKMFA